MWARIGNLCSSLSILTWPAPAGGAVPLHKPFFPSLPTHSLFACLSLPWISPLLLERGCGSPCAVIRAYRAVFWGKRSLQRTRTQTSSQAPNKDVRRSGPSLRSGPSQVQRRRSTFAAVRGQASPPSTDGAVPSLKSPGFEPAALLRLSPALMLMGADGGASVPRLPFNCLSQMSERRSKWLLPRSQWAPSQHKTLSQDEPVNPRLYNMLMVISLWFAAGLCWTGRHGRGYLADS